MDDRPYKLDLSHAVRLAKAGEREKARQVLLEIVRASPQNQVAWFWLVEVTDSHSERVKILQQCYLANPTSERVKKALAKLLEESPATTDQYILPERSSNPLDDIASSPEKISPGTEEVLETEAQSPELLQNKKEKKTWGKGMWINLISILMLFAIVAVAVLVLRLNNEILQNSLDTVITATMTITSATNTSEKTPEALSSPIPIQVQPSPMPTYTLTPTQTIVAKQETVISPSPYVPVRTATHAPTSVISNPPDITLDLLFSLDGASPVSVNPVGNLIASIRPNRNTSIQLWDPTTGEMVRQFGHDDHVVRCMAFSADGKILATGGDDQQVHLWDVSTGEFITAFVRHNGTVISVDFNPDLRIVGSVDRSPAVLLWIFQNNDILRRVEGLKERIYDLDFNPNGDTYATGGADGAVRIWRVSDGRQIQLLLGHADAVRSVAFRNDGIYLASGSGLTAQDNSVWLWDIETGEGKKLTPSADQPVLSVAFSPDGQLLAAGLGGDGKGNGFLLWHIDTGKLLLSYDIAEPVKDVAFSRDGSLLLVGTDQRILVFTLSTSR